MLGGPQNGQNEPQNLTTSAPPPPTAMMISTQHNPQWHIHPQQHVHMMPYPPPPDPGQAANAPHQPTVSQPGPPPVPPSAAQETQHIPHMVQESTLNQMQPPHIDHSIWSAAEIQASYGMEEIRGEGEEVIEEEEQEIKPKIKKEVRKKRKLADLLAEGIDPTKLEENSDQVRDRFSKGCECESDNCFRNMNPEFVFRHRLNIAELTKNEHDLYLMGVTMACLANPEETSRHKERKRLRASYVFQGKKVCLDAFLYLENCTHYQLKAIRKHVIVNGVTPRVHGNHGKKPPNTFPLDAYQHAAAFLTSYITRYSPSQHSPKKQNKSGKSPPVFLPAELTRKKIHSAYKEFCEHFEPEVKIMGYSSFRHFMKDQFPNVKFFRIDKKNEKITHSDEDDDEHEAAANGNVEPPPQTPQLNPEQRLHHGMDANNQPQVIQQQQVPHSQQQPQPRPHVENQKDPRNTPPVTSTGPPLPPHNPHPVVPVSMPHVAISSAYPGYSHVQLPLNLQTQQPLYSPCMQPGVFPPGQPHQPQVRPTVFPPYTNL